MRRAGPLRPCPPRTSTDSGNDAPPEVQWLLSKGKKGHLHLRDTCGGEGARVLTLCGRKLADPEEGSGMACARMTSAEWPPRCWARLLRASMKCWAGVAEEQG